MRKLHKARYEERLRAIREVARRFPGRADADCGLGLWAGVYLQTKWQKDSGREDLRVWNLVNANLTVAPLAYAREYSRNSALKPNELSGAKVWKDFFGCQDSAAALCRSDRRADRIRGILRMRFIVPRKFWRAHNASIALAVREHFEIFRDAPPPKEELAFWSGWIRFLVFCEMISPPTTDFVLRRFLTAAMPPTSPLGGAGDRIQDQPLLRRVFLNAVAAIGNSADPTR
jgi:hypothetical protein